MALEHVIKVILEFKEAFWQEEKKNIGFLFTGEKIPTWWTQLPKNNCILTGWMAGPKALEFKDASDEDILECSLKFFIICICKTSRQF